MQNKLIVLVLFMSIRYMLPWLNQQHLRRPPVPAPSVAPAGEFLGTAVDRERRRGRGTLSNASGRYEPTARIAFDDGWQLDRGIARLRDDGHRGEGAQDHHAQRLARHRLRPLDQSLSRLRAWLRLLLRAPDARQHGALGRARFRIQAVREAGRAGTARARTRRAALFAARDRDRHQHRSLSADRAAHTR